MTKLSGEMEEAVNDELTVFYRMSGVMIQMLMFDAEQKNATLHADVSYMENYKALEQMKDFEDIKTLTSGTPAASTFSMTPMGGLKKGSQLPTLGSAMMQQQMLS
jgi:alkylated DNA repair dioxygenase AlkB